MGQNALFIPNIPGQSLMKKSSAFMLCILMSQTPPSKEALPVILPKSPPNLSLTTIDHMYHEITVNWNAPFVYVLVTMEVSYNK